MKGEWWQEDDDFALSCLRVEGAFSLAPESVPSLLSLAPIGARMLAAIFGVSNLSTSRISDFSEVCAGDDSSAATMQLPIVLGV